MDGKESLEELFCLLLMMFLVEILSVSSQRKEPVEDRREGIVGGTWLQRGVQGKRRPRQRYHC